MNNIARILVTVCIIAAQCGMSYADYDKAKVERVITEQGRAMASDPRLPGISIAVLRKGGDVPVSVAFGTACIENATTMTTKSKSKIGSVTKVFTSALIQGLIEEGKLEYDTTIDRFFPDFPDGSKITVRNLLNHTSGIVDMLSLPEVRANMAKYLAPDEIIAMAGKQPLLFEPGTSQQYSNTGYLMLGRISEMASGMPYAMQIRRMFSEKLGMKSLVVGNDSSVVPGLACGYSLSDNASPCLPMMASLAIAMGTGNLEAAPEDIVRLVNLDQALANDVRNTAATAPLTLHGGKSAMRTVPEGTYAESYLDGCTLLMFKEPEITLVGKIGSFPGYGTVYLYDQKTKIAVALGVNNEKVIPEAISMGARILHDLRD